MKLTFLGATGTVTGSRYLLENKDKKFLIDCGLFQGLKELRLRNWEQFDVPPASIDAMLLTHAHLDHSGYIPRLVKSGFKGPIYCSEATYDLCAILLPDSGRLQEEDAEHANRHGYTQHKPALPLYTEQEARDCLKQFKPVEFTIQHSLNNLLNFTLYPAGHILGASFIRMSDSSTSIMFTGDIGRLNDPIMKAPTQISGADYLVMESTYGDRLHDQTDPMLSFGNIINKTIKRGGTLVIPAFAVGRAEAIMYYIYKLKMEKRIPDHLPVYLDSPMAINVAELMCKYLNGLRLSNNVCELVSNIATYVRTPEESKKVDEMNMPSIIISASGMATGGRVLHHLKRFVGDARNTVLLAGYQAAGTRGDRLARGEKEIEIHGQMWPVKAEILKLDNMSAHADYGELLEWMSHFTKKPRKIFIIHGEQSAAESLKQKIEDRYGWQAIVPTYKQTENL